MKRWLFSEAGAMSTTTISIAGMSCNHCVATVRKALSAVPGVAVQDVAIGSATIEIDPAAGSLSAAEQAIDSAGFDVVKGRVLPVQAAPARDPSTDA